MEAKELRIGNFITSKSSSTYWEINIDDLILINENPSHYLPIPITEEWLLKFGFIKDAVLFSITENDEHKSVFSIQYDNHLEVFKIPITGFWYEIKYIHQLQNLYFALTNQELTLKQ
jgi:hypothetical protein